VLSRLHGDYTHCVLDADTGYHVVGCSWTRGGRLRMSALSPGPKLAYFSEGDRLGSTGYRSVHPTSSVGVAFRRRGRHEVDRALDGMPVTDPQGCEMVRRTRWLTATGPVAAVGTGLFLAVAMRLSSASQADVATTDCATAPASPPSGFTNQTASVNGVQLHYVRGGHGRDVVVLLHGWPENWYEWNAVMPTLAEKYTVLAVDLPGLGDSIGAPPSYDKKTLAGFVHGLVVDAVGERRASRQVIWPQLSS